MVQNIVITKTFAESDNSEHTIFSSPTLWDNNGDSLIVYKNNNIILKKNIDYILLSTNSIQLTNPLLESESITFIITKLDTQSEIYLDRIIKQYNNKTQTSLNKTIYEETIPTKFIIHNTEIWSSSIDSNPANAVTSGVAYQYTNLILYEDVSVNDHKGWYASTDGSINSRIINWIPPKFGIEYSIILKDANGNIIPTSDPIEWVFDYQAGYLFIKNNHNYPIPFKIDGYVYTGNFGTSVENLEIPFWKEPVNSYSDLPITNNTNGDIRLVLDEYNLYSWDSNTSTWNRTNYVENKFKDPVNTYLDLPLTNNEDGDIRLVLDTNYLYRWNSSSNEWQIIIYQHNHDDRYYKKNEVDTLLSTKTDIDHVHDTLYYRKPEVDNFIRWLPSVATPDDLPLWTDNRDGDVRLTRNNNIIWRFDYFGAPGGKWVPLNEMGLTWKAPVNTEEDLPIGPDATNLIGDVRLVLNVGKLKWWDGTQWLDFAGSGSGGITSLDEAYDGGVANGYGRIITVDSGPVEFNASNNSSHIKFNSITYIPENPSDGQLFFSNGIIYIYDEFRAQWISINKQIISFGSKKADGNFISLNNISNKNSSWIALRKGIILGISAVASSGYANKEIILYINNDDKLTFNLNNYKYLNNILGIQFNTGDLIKFFVSSKNAAVNNLLINIEIGWIP